MFVLEVVFLALGITFLGLWINVRANREMLRVLQIHEMQKPAGAEAPVIETPRTYRTIYPIFPDEVPPGQKDPTPYIVDDSVLVEIE